MKQISTLFSILFFLPLSGYAACERVVVTGDPEYPPLVSYDGKTMRGAAVELVATALEKIHLPYKLEYAGPFLRVLDSIKGGKVDIVVELKKNEEREAYTSYAKTPIFENPIAVFVRSDNPMSFKGRNDLKLLRGGITLGNKFGGGLDEFIAKELKAETAPNIQSNFDKLKFHRIDYFVTGYYPGYTYLVKAKRTSEFRVLKPFITSSANFVGWSKKSECLGRLEEFNQVLKGLMSSGAAAKMLHSNLTENQVPTF